MSAVFKREFKAYMNNVYGYLFMAVLLFFVGGLVSYFNIIQRLPGMEVALFYGRYILLLMIPILCMRSMAEDRHNKTDLFYLSLPLKQSSVVLGKFFALLSVFAIPTAVMALYPLLLGAFGSISYGGAYTTLLFFFLVGAALIALCQFLSSLTENLVVAAVLGVVGSVILCFIPVLGYVLPDAPIVSYIGLALLSILFALLAFVATRSLLVTALTGGVLLVPLSVCYVFMADRFEGVLAVVLEYISPFHHFEEIATIGVLNLPSLVLLLSYPVFFVTLTVLSADRKRYA